MEEQLSLWWVMCVATILLLWALGRWWSARGRWRLDELKPPGPPAWPLVGHLHLLAGGTPHSALAELAQQYGPLMHIRLGLMPTLVVSSSDLAREFLFTHDRAFSSRPPFACAARLKGGQDSGLAMARLGPAWSELRRISHAQLFTSSRVKAALPLIMEELQLMLADVRDHAIHGAAYNVSRGTSLLLDNIICRLLFGRTLAEAFDARFHVTLKEKVQEGVALFSTRPMVGDFVPWLSFLDIPHAHRIDAWIASVHDLLHDMVTKRRPSSNCPKDLLDSLLLADKDPDSIKVILMDFLAGGVDTPSVTLDWAMSELLLHPISMTRLQEELNTVVGNPFDTPLVQEGHLPQLAYTKAIVKEVFRLHSPVPLLMPHYSSADCQVAGYNIRKGTRLFVNVWAIGRDPKVWNRPNEFFPDRFLGACEEIDVRGMHFELLPFGSGRRMCPGIHLALPIIEITLANLIHSFHWSIPPPLDDKIDMSTKLGSVLCRATPLIAIPSLRT